MPRLRFIRLPACPAMVFAMLLAGCAGVPSFVAMPGTVERASIQVYDARRNADLEVGVVIHRPVQPSPLRPAVLMLSGCSGNFGSGARELTRWLLERGAVVAEVQSIQAFGNSCSGHPPPLSGMRRTDHAWLARDLLVQRNLADVRNVGVAGFSHGGWTIVSLIHMQASTVRLGDRPPFAAAVAYYPLCLPLEVPRQPAATPTLMLLGGADDWTPAAPCEQMAATDALIETHTYPNAAHSFDVQAAPRQIETNGRWVSLAFDAAASADALTRAKAKLAQHLRF